MCLASCKTFQVAETKTTANTPEIALEFSNQDIANEQLRNDANAFFDAFIAKWNAEKHSFTIRPKLKKEKDYITFDVVRAKMVGTTGKVLGYVITLAGTTLLPYALIAGETGIVAIVWFIPHHQIDDMGELSPDLSADKRSGGRIISGANALFQSNKKARANIIKQLDKKMQQTLVSIEKQLARHAALSN